jgi:hypothetical protein
MYLTDHREASGTISMRGRWALAAKAPGPQAAAGSGEYKVPFEVRVI